MKKDKDSEVKKIQEEEQELLQQMKENLGKMKDILKTDDRQDNN